MSRPFLGQPGLNEGAPSLTQHPTILHIDGSVGLRGSWEGGIMLTAVISSMFTVCEALHSAFLTSPISDSHVTTRREAL